VTPTAADVILPSGALVALIALGLVEVARVIFCIVDIVRRPAVLGDRKWVWIVVVAVFNLVGPIIYLAIGRAQPPLPETRAEPHAAGGRAAAAADILYGPAPGAEGPGADAPSPPRPGAPGEDS
jgi:hypothetical protein